MDRRTITGMLGLGLAGLGIARYRRHLIGHWLGLPPPRYDVGVTRNLPVPMPDGIHLLADHYTPKAPGPFPTILIRSPYGRGAEAGISGRRFAFIAHRFAERGYHVVVQGTRGRFGSEGDFEPFVHEATDGQATIQWIQSQPWFNGALGMWGPSYLGYVQWAVAANTSSHLKALSPSFICAQGYALTYQAGAFALDLTLRWLYLLEAQEEPFWKFLYRMSRQEHTLTSAFQHLPLREADLLAVGRRVPFYRDWLSHADSNDPYWQPADHRATVARISVPMHLMSGWYDLFLNSMLADYAALKAAGHRPYLTIGPWSHVDTAAAWAALREGMTWLDVHLKGDRRRLRQHPVRIYVMGAHEWREMEHWPPPAIRTHY